MATVRAVVAEALRALRVTAPGDEPVADELAAGVEAAQALVLEIHQGRGPLREIDVAADHVAAEDQRVRIAAGATVEVVLPNAVALSPDGPSADRGSAGPADGVLWRAPADGARIEIVGVDQGLYFYRADLNVWSPGLGLTLDSELPFNARLSGAFAALLAERLADPVAVIPSPMLSRRIGRARAAMFIQPGRARTRRVGEYF